MNNYRLYQLYISRGFPDEESGQAVLRRIGKL